MPLEAAGGYMNTEYDWVKLYKAALLETDWSRIGKRIEATEDALKARLHEFSLNHGGTPEENKAIVKTLDGLKILRSDVSAWRMRESNPKSTEHFVRD